MTQPWAVIIAAVSAALVSGGFALLGHGVGLRNGRLQVADQAAVEHEQWLRGQRQTAYVELLAAWDKVIVDFFEAVEILGHLLDGPGSEEDGRVRAVGQLYAITAPLPAVLERVMLLGPAPCEKLAKEMETAMGDVREGLRSSIPGIDPDMVVEVDENKAWDDLARLRNEFFDLARDVLRTAPAPALAVTRSWLRRPRLPR
ncbi:hypothetical protein ACWCPS_36100 [Streptomyces mauvecolor]